MYVVIGILSIIILYALKAVFHLLDKVGISRGCSCGETLDNFYFTEKVLATLVVLILIIQTMPRP